MKECLLQVYEPSLQKTIQIGKFTRNPAGQWVYFFDLTGGNRKLCVFDALGIAPCVLAAMEERGIKLINVGLPGGRCYEITAEEVKKHGILKSFKGRSVRHYHVPLSLWRFRAPYRPPWTNDVLTLRWQEIAPESPPPPAAEQPRLF